MAIALRYAARSDIGLGRYKENQDSGYAGPHLLVVADGMGGNAGGDVASSLAVGRLAALDGESHGADALQHLEHAVRGAAGAVRDRARDQPELSGMATTVTAILRSGNRLALAHIGDSRAYLLHDGEVTQVTADHTFVQRLVDEGRITAEEAERHPQGNIVMRMLGDIDSNDDIDSSVRTAEVGDRWLLCSDGLSGFVSLDTIAETMTEVEDPGACAERLIQLALRGGGADNITAIVADVVPATTRAADPPRGRRARRPGSARGRAPLPPAAPPPRRPPSPAPPRSTTTRRSRTTPAPRAPPCCGACSAACSCSRSWPAACTARGCGASSSTTWASTATTSRSTRAWRPTSGRSSCRTCTSARTSRSTASPPSTATPSSAASAPTTCPTRGAPW